MTAQLTSWEISLTVPDVQIKAPALPRSVYFLTQPTVSYRFSKLSSFLLVRFLVEGKKDQLIFELYGFISYPI